MKKRSILSIVLSAIVLALPLVSCKSSPKHKVTDAYPDKKVGFQLEKPEKGEEIAIMHTSMGDIKIRLFPEAAPKAVENFVTHAKNGYYNGVTFHRVIDNFMIQGGDPKGDGTGGESIYGKPFEDEFDRKLLNLRGALSMANSGIYGKPSNGSQFFINQTPPEKFPGKEYFQNLASQYHSQYNSKKAELLQEYNYYKDQIDSIYGSFDAYFKSSYYLAPDPKLVPDEVWELYEKYGGNIYLDGAWREANGHTVFGQVFEGLDVVDAIAAVKTDSKTNKPLEDVKINSIEIVKYEG
ncbi:MAG TPA: peptidylprolyl isomerase [Candidatus Avimonas sp.]|nr:peptidylprolyl isomerase [Clostridiales bacterium]HPU58401.1 peptidylprolyl isomerase [Candidatus Avimonas sp.]